MTAIKILIVEDQGVMLDALRQYAEQPSNRDIQIVGTAETEEDAIEVLQSRQFDIAIIDMRLPRERGGPRDNEAGLRLITLAAQQHKALKMLAMSAEMEKPAFIIRVIRSGASGYVLKEGATLGDIFDAVRNIYQGRKVYPPEVVQFLVDGNSKSLDDLTEREREVWRLVAEGLTNQEIGQRLSISLDAVKRCTSELYDKIGVANRAQATRKWLEDQYGGLTEVDAGS
jgi:DNA-binding NarL/FixJ family response regulator